MYCYFEDIIAQEQIINKQPPKRYASIGKDIFQSLPLILCVPNT
jgi:hypothetical protein